MMLTASRLIAADLFAIERHPDQMVQMGIAAFDRDVAEAMASGTGVGDEAWALRWHGTLVACVGLVDQFGNGRHAVAWAVIGNGIGTAHLAVTRFSRRMVERSVCDRVEATCHADANFERVIGILVADGHALDAQAMIEIALLQPTPAIRFAIAAGLKPAHVLRAYGAAAEPCLLMERIRG